MQNQVKIIITEDKAQFRKALIRDLIHFGVKTIAEAENGVELLKLLRDHSPDVILLDLRMPVMDGSITMEYLNYFYPELKVIILTFHDEKVLIEDFASRDVSGYITKDEVSGDPELLSKLIKKVHLGTKHITQNKANANLIFTEIQKDIVQLEGKGATKKEISQVTGLKENAVGKQRRKIMEKIGVKTMAAFYSYLTMAGLEFLRKPKGKG